MSITKKIFSTPELKEKPPVLIDIGASGEIHPYWKAFARHSFCIAFEPDNRKIGYLEKEHSGFGKLILYNAIVTDTDAKQIEFNLTKSPYCSSVLEPNLESLKNWHFYEKFIPEKKVSFTAVRLTEVLKEQNITYIDWYKSDSQGLDLRLFRSLPESVQRTIKIAEFEPGIMSAYHGEDKMFSILSYLEEKEFWLAHLQIKGPVRINYKDFKVSVPNNFIRKILSFNLPHSPGWGEMLYVNNFENVREKRDFYLGWLFAMTICQYGFALNLAKTGFEKFDDPLFNEMMKLSTKKIQSQLFSFKTIKTLYEGLRYSLRV